MKFRIVEYTHSVDNLKYDSNRVKIEYVIEKRTMFGWKEVFNKELKKKRISHKTYNDAESYMVENYMGHGFCKKIGVEYQYIDYTYFDC